MYGTKLELMAKNGQKTTNLMKIIVFFDAMFSLLK